MFAPYYTPQINNFFFFYFKAQLKKSGQLISPVMGILTFLGQNFLKLKLTTFLGRSCYSNYEV